MLKLVAGAATALRRLLDALLIVLIVIVLFGVVLGKVVPLTGRQTLIVGGPSMEPHLPLGAAVIIRAVEPASLAVGDIVSLQPGPGGSVFTHRIVEIVDRTDGRWVRTKGDANGAPDPTLVPVAGILGRMEVAIPWAGYLLALMTLPAGVVFLLGLAASLLAAAWLLESLEIEAADRRRRRTPSAIPTPASPTPVSPTLARGEPIAVRPPTGRRRRSTKAVSRPMTMQLLAEPLGSLGSPSFPISPRATVGERIAASRETRRRRARWQADAARRTTPGPD
jgi:signal peptidase